MKTVTTPQELQKHLIKLKRDGKSVAAVPTMGALHEGHLALVSKAKELADVVVVSIFVNPIQFNESSDFDSYPRTFDVDCELAQEKGADFVYAPTVDSMYPQGFDTTVSCGGITSELEGAARPGHFDGVTTVVLKLFSAMLPDVAVFGQKDAQQLLVISKMVRDLNLPVAIVAHPTVREEDGLAQSSRNRLLTAPEREDVVKISQGLFAAQKSYEAGETKSDVLVTLVRDVYSTAQRFSVEYIALTNRACQPVTTVPQEGALLSVACRCRESGVRLIDNVALGALWG